MSEQPPDDQPNRFRPRLSRARNDRAQTHGQVLLTRGLRVLEGKPGGTANRVFRIARGQLVRSPKSAIASIIRAAAGRGQNRAPRRHLNSRGAGVRGIGRHAQRVVVKARIAPTRGKNAVKAIRQHLTYIERDGVDRSGGPGRIFDSTAELDRNQVEAFAERGAASRHQFRFIVSPERGGDLDLERFTRDLMRRMEHDVGTALDYVACVHHDTDQPHVHVVVNGTDHRGGDLVISRDYIGNGLRHRAMELATNELGFRTDLDLFQSLARDVHADRFTAIDRRLQTLQERDPRGLIDLRAMPSAPRAILQRRLHLGRLAWLRDAGLADELARGVWRLAPDAIERLRGHTQHREIQRHVERHMEPADRAGSVEIIDKAKLAVPITGKVLGRGLANELTGTNYLVAAGLDGKTYYASLSIHSERHLGASVRRGDIVTLRREIARPTGQADRNVAAIAARNDGIYDPERHLADLRTPTARLPFVATPERFVAAHVSRLDALASRAHVVRQGDGTYRVPSDLLSRIASEAIPGRDDAFIKVELRSHQPLRDQIHAIAPTWLDDQLVAGLPQRLQKTAIRTRFQDDVMEAADQRARRLVQLGLARFEGEGVQLDPHLRARLARLELDAAATRLSRDYGNYSDLNQVRQFTGRVVAIESLSSGPHAVVVSDQHFAIAPAERGLAQLVGKDVALSVTPDRAVDDALQTRVRFRVLDAMELSPSLGPSLGR